MLANFDLDLLKHVSEKLMKEKQTVAVAESVTSGQLQFLFSNMPDAAQFFQGGITPYNLGQKTKHLDVEPLHAARVNCVSERVAIEMASSVAFFFNADWSMAITGYATPSPESDNQLFAWYAITFNNEVLISEKIVPTNTEPALVQNEYANKVLKEFLKLC